MTVHLKWEGILDHAEVAFFDQDNKRIESSFRLADAVNSMHHPPGTHHGLGCKVILTINIRVFFFALLLEIMFMLTAVYKTVTPPLGSEEEMSML